MFTVNVRPRLGSGKGVGVDTDGVVVSSRGEIGVVEVAGGRVVSTRLETRVADARDSFGEVAIGAGVCSTGGTCVGVPSTI